MRCRWRGNELVNKYRGLTILSGNHLNPPDAQEKNLLRSGWGTPSYDRRVNCRETSQVK